MYQQLLKHYVKRQFSNLSEGDFESVLHGVDDNVHHRFAGQHALGGERHTKRSLRLWFERLFRLCPKMSFEVHSVTISGWLWNLTVAAEWSATVTPAKGADYVNSGVHVIRIRRGRVVQLYAYEDSQAVAAACRIMAELGVDEASAAPIED